MKSIETKMDSKLNQLDSLMNMLNEKSAASIVGNVTETIHQEKDVGKDIAKDVTSNIIDKSVENINQSK